VPIGREVIYRGDGINWTETPMDTVAFITSDNETVMIPIRFLAYALLQAVYWSDDESTATLSPGTADIEISPWAITMMVRGETISIRNCGGILIPAYLHAEHERILIPLRALGEVFNISFRFDEDAQEAVFYPAIPLNASDLYVPE